MSTVLTSFTPEELAERIAELERKIGVLEVVIGSCARETEELLFACEEFGERVAGIMSRRHV